MWKFLGGWVGLSGVWHRKVCSHFLMLAVWMGPGVGYTLRSRNRPSLRSLLTLRGLHTLRTQISLTTLTTQISLTTLRTQTSLHSLTT